MFYLANQIAPFKHNQIDYLTKIDSKGNKIYFLKVAEYFSQQQFKMISKYIFYGLSLQDL